jgi:hypothetical protein
MKKNNQISPEALHLKDVREVKATIFQVAAPIKVILMLRLIKLKYYQIIKINQVSICGKILLIKNNI